MFERFVERRAEEALSDTPVVLIVGPRRAGKTTLVRKMGEAGRTYITLDDQTVLEAAQSDPAGFIRGLDRAIIDEIPREYEEAALVDGYTRLQALRKVVLPQAVTGIAATAIFCLIFSWNEYAFAVLLTSGDAQTMPPFIPFIIGEGGQDWPAVAAATTLFVIPIVLFTILLRKHLLRGITFGAVRK